MVDQQDDSIPDTKLAGELRAEYSRRDQALHDRDLYSPLNPGHLFMLQSRQQATLRALTEAGVHSLSGLHILEVGCGKGGVLLEYLGLGAHQALLCGIDVLEDRVAAARELLPRAHLVTGDAQDLPFDGESFDVVLQYTAFSSVLDRHARARMAAEMMRVLRKPAGLIIWYDFWTNPTNRQTCGIRLPEIRSLFPGCRVAARRITLAPPLVRRIAPCSFLACGLLESFRLLNSHYLAVIQPAEANVAEGRAIPAC